MALPVWGNLEKSQIDNETIEEAIARLIQDHEDDANAHIEAGESLETHKASEIIDHPQSSVVADKFPSGNVLVQSTFENIDAFDHQEESFTRAFPGITLFTAALEPSLAFISAPPGGAGLVFFKNNPLIQTTFAINATAGKTVYLTIGNTLAGGDANGAGFKIATGKLYAMTYVNSVEVTEELENYDITKPYTIRIVVRSADNEVDFYVDGVLETTMAFTPSVDVDVAFFHFSIAIATDIVGLLGLSGIFAAVDELTFT